MTDYIEKEAARLAVMRAGYLENILPTLDAVPAADVAPVVHGRWVDVADKPHLFYECSLCKERWGYGAMLHMNYCPNCGARMDGEWYAAW